MIAIHIQSGKLFALILFRAFSSVGLGWQLGDSDLDWISYGDKCLMNVDDPQWTSDLLFSTISQPFAFPDQREIGKPIT